MKLRTRLLSICTVVALTVATLAMSVSAVEPTNVRISQGNRELRKGRTFQLSVTYTPRDADENTDLTYWSEDPEIVEVDNDGVVRAIDYGSTRVYVETGNRKTHYITVTVPTANNESASNSQDSEGRDTDLTSSSSSTSSTRSSSSSAPTATTVAGTIELTDKISRETLVSAVQSAGTGRATLSNYASVSAESLQAAANAGTSSVNFDTKSGNTVVGRLVINPANAANLSGDISLGVYAKTGNTQSVQNTFNKYYKNDITVIRCAQSDYAMNVEVVAKVGNLNADNLRFYSYNSTDNKYTDLTVSNVSVDRSGYVHFTTTKGGYIVVSNGALSK